PLAHQHHIRSRRDYFLKLRHAGGFQTRLEKILKEFSTEQVEPVATYSAKYGVKKAGRENAIGRIEERTRDREHAHSSAASPPLEKALRVPGEEAHGPHGCEV